MSTITTTEMQRDYIKEYSPSLGREMEVLHFGHGGRPLLVFPTFIALSGAFDTDRWLNGYHDDNTYFTNLMAFLPGLDDQAYLAPLREQRPKVIATGEHDPNVDDSIKLARLFVDKGVQVGLDIWP